MGLFDNINKKRNNDNKNDKKKKFSMDEYLKQKKKDEQLGMSIRGDILIKVYPNAIVNGVFVVPKTVRQIDAFACPNQSSLKTLVLHEDINYIGMDAFEGCENLAEIKGLENASNLHAISGFANCKNLKKVTLPENIERIGSEAFLENTMLSEINLPDTCWCISENAFAGCENLKLIQIPACAEIIDKQAFAGCKNATIVFLEDGKKLLSDYINEQKEAYSELYDEDFEEQSNLARTEANSEIPAPTLEEKIQVYEDFNIRYRIVNFAGEQFLQPSKPLDVNSDAFAGVKEIVSSSESKLESVIKSGYKGRLSLAQAETNELFTIDIATLEEMNQTQQDKMREKYYSRFLIPAEGTTSWLINCEMNNYKAHGYAGKLVWEKPIYSDAKISINDFTQPKSGGYKYTREDEGFFTCVSFHKKELVTQSNLPAHEYNRIYSIYYPYGARFNTELLTQVGMALSILIDTARDLRDNSHNQEQLKLIAEKQKQIIDLFITGTNDKNAVAKIMNDPNLRLGSPATSPKPAKSKKDWLPYFSNPLFDEFDNLKEYQKQQQQKNQSHEPERD